MKAERMTLSKCRGSELWRLVEYIAEFRGEDILKIIDSYEPWIYEYAVFIYATHITEELMNFIAKEYSRTSDDQKTNLDHAISSYICNKYYFNGVSGANLVDLLVNAYYQDPDLLKSFLMVQGNYCNNYLHKSSIYLEFILKTRQNVKNYIANHNIHNFSIFDNKDFDLEDYIVFLRNFHKLISYNDKPWLISTHNYINYLGTKAIAACMEFAKQIGKSGKLESGDVVVSKSVIDNLLTLREFQMLEKGVLKPTFNMRDEK